jgi:NAD(P)-dependent dehydrogenase (short-subunit alcohol dehydrogenase family)
MYGQPSGCRHARRIGSPRARKASRSSARKRVTRRRRRAAAEACGRWPAAVAYLASDDAAFVPGTALLVDGGLVRY